MTAGSQGVPGCSPVSPKISTVSNLQVASLDALRGQACVVPLLEYGVTSSISGTRQWVLVFPQYAGSMREWRLRWRGKGLDAQDLPVYLRLFIQVRAWHEHLGCGTPHALLSLHSQASLMGRGSHGSFCLHCC